MDPYESTRQTTNDLESTEILDIFRNDVLQQIIFINIIYVFWSWITHDGSVVSK
jgi:hypothetical protein